MIPAYRTPAEFAEEKDWPELKDIIVERDTETMDFADAVHQITHAPIPGTTIDDPEGKLIHFALHRHIALLQHCLHKDPPEHMEKNLPAIWTRVRDLMQQFADNQGISLLDLRVVD
jgi:hypothetical protein